MKRRLKRDVRVVVEEQNTRYQPDPHRRNRVIESKKIYSRKASSEKAGPYDFVGRARMHDRAIGRLAITESFRCAKLLRPGPTGR